MLKDLLGETRANITNHKIRESIDDILVKQPRLNDDIEDLLIQQLQVKDILLLMVLRLLMHLRKKWVIL